MAEGSRLAACVVCAAVLVGTGERPAARQAPTRRATTTAALTTFPSFYGGQQVVVRAEVIVGPGLARLAGDGPPIYVIRQDPLPKGMLEIRGEFWDLARLPPDDPRLNSRNLDAALGPVEERRLKPGDAFCLIVRSAIEASPPAAPTVRTVVLDPARYLDQRVTLTGQFRGRNLYGDVPQAPGVSRWDFVVRLADASVWVTGIRPRGKDLDLDPGARVDTGRWVEVSGVVRFQKGLTWIEANQVQPARPVAEIIEEEGPAPAVVGPAPEVVFSAPTEEETDVSLDTAVRIQFSRDLDRATIDGQVRVAYVTAGSTSPADPPPALPDMLTQYDPAGRVLVVRFARPLDPLQTVKLDLLEGIRAHDGVPLKPWTLTFKLGS